MLVATHAFASADNVSNALQIGQPPSIQLTLSKQADAAIRLEARAAPLAQILKAIADKTGVNIHYSVLPEAPVTVTCVGANVGEVMDCLVAKQVGLVAHKSQKDKPAEFWLLGSSVGSCQAVIVAQSSVQEIQPTEPANVPTEPSQDEIEQNERFIKEYHSQDPGIRATAIYNLGVAGIKDDPNVELTIREALHDKDPNVRSNAINSLSQRGGQDLEIEINNAIKDENPNVRFAATALVKDDVALLQQALGDNDHTVRELAKSKLDNLTIKQN